ncbi:hypothetical protein Godav_011554 [Gossypium davidsonii]|uniref:Uncharacterized protein n=1 Tax=Gossypium davidsonii TaxID=34287 RepID=A0A7J8RA98_GOSDV|nr:hypothetical protein [Gossypium davidsonii]
MGGVKETLEVVKGRTDELDSMKEVFNVTMDDQTEKLTKRNDALNVMIMTLKKDTKAMMSTIEELKRELVVCRFVVGKGMLALASKQRIEQYFREIGIKDDATEELKKHFYPYYVKKEARAKLHLLMPKRHCSGVIIELTIIMAKPESFIELGSRKDKFESSKPKETGNGRRDHDEEQDKNGNGDNSKNNGDDEPTKAPMKLGSILSSVEAKRVKENAKKLRSKISTINKEKVDPKSEALKLGSVILNYTNSMTDCKQKRLMFVDINIAGRRRSALVDTRLLGLFVSKNATSKLGLSTCGLETIVSDTTEKRAVTQGVKLQISKWKGKEDFKVIHVDDYDFVLGLNFFDQINALSIPFADCICILDTRQRQCIVLVSHDEKGRTKVFSIIQLVENVHCGKNIDLVDRSANETTLEMLEVQQN